MTVLRLQRTSKLSLAWFEHLAQCLGVSNVFEDRDLDGAYVVSGIMRCLESRGRQTDSKQQ